MQQNKKNIDVSERNFILNYNFSEFYVCHFYFELCVNYYSTLKRSFMTKLENVI